MRPFTALYACIRTAVVLSFSLALATSSLCAKQSAPKPAEKAITNPSKEPSSSGVGELPAQIELLETRVRFEANGDSRKEVHARVHINSELGARQFARLNFHFNRSFESVEVPQVRITHPSGGTADILPSSITDNPNPAVINAPPYQDVRVKSVRILGLQPGDTLEYRVITTVSRHPLAPDFWLDHTFDRSGVVSREVFALDLPVSRLVQMKINPATPATSNSKSSEGETARSIYKWEHSTAAQDNSAKDVPHNDPDLVVTTLPTWAFLSEKVAAQFQPSASIGPEVKAKAQELTGSAKNYDDELAAIYDFVSQRIKSVDLPLGSTNFRFRAAGEVLSSGVATQEDKCILLSALAAAVGISTSALLAGAPPFTETQLPSPRPFTHLLMASSQQEHSVWLDPSVEVAPFGMIPSNLRGKPALKIENWAKLRSESPLGSTIPETPCWQTVGSALPFRASQKVDLDASLGSDGKLTAKVRYSMRGDNELLLRIGFHQTSKEKWKELAQLLSISDGFRGQVTSVNASDPYATKEPFTVEYEIEQPKFVDWSKKPLRIPALLPQLGLPEPAAQPKAGAAAPPIELGTPLEVETRMTLHLPADTRVVPPTGASIQRDYATFRSQYAAQGQTLSASRHIHFLREKIPADRAIDYNAFLRAVQNDEAQVFSVEHSATPAAQPPGQALHL